MLDYINNMASFRTHASSGVSLGFLIVMGILFFSISDNFGLLVAVFLVATLGSVLPDIDSDSGIPFHITFGSLSFISGTFVFAELFRREFPMWWEGLAWSVGTMGAVWVVGGYFFKRFTKHRGMAHSIPAAILFGLLVFFFGSRFSFGDADAFLLAVSGILGYIIHLILDEMYAAVNFSGKVFTPKRSLGSALKLFSHSRKITVALYGLLLFLFAGNVNRFYDLAITFWRKVA